MKVSDFFTIRMAKPEDASGMLDIYGPIIRNTVTSFELTVPSENAFGERIRGYLQDYPWLVAEKEGKVAGYAYASRHRERDAYNWSVETSAYVHPDFQRMGLGRSLYEHLLEILRAQGFFNAYAIIVLPNENSIRFHESLGFEPVGICRQAGFKAGGWHDTGWWQYLLNRGENGAEIRDWRDLSAAEMPGEIYKDSERNHNWRKR